MTYEHNNGGVCPNCGYCQHCGRGQQFIPMYPLYPTTPGWPSPWRPTIFVTTTPTITIGPNTAGAHTITNGPAPWTFTSACGNV